MKSELQLLKEANDIMRSMNAIIDRKGQQTFWDGISKKVKMALAEQHEVLVANNCYIPVVISSAYDEIFEQASKIDMDNDIDYGQFPL